MNEGITYIGLDVHKETISVALAVGSRRGRVFEHGRISNTPAAVTRLASKLSETGSVLRFCYEAGRAATVSNGNWLLRGMTARWWPRR